MASATKGSHTGSKAGSNGKTTTTTKHTRSKAGPSGSTRTAARSAKRRSPKSNDGDDAELLEVERVEFLKAMDAYKRKTGQTFPSWSEVLGVLRGIGWLSPMRIAASEASKPR